MCPTRLIKCDPNETHNQTTMQQTMAQPQLDNDATAYDATQSNNYAIAPRKCDVFTNFKKVERLCWMFVDRWGAVAIAVEEGKHFLKCVCVQGGR